jgi:hypothetical protein
MRVWKLSPVLILMCLSNPTHAQERANQKEMSCRTPGVIADDGYSVTIKNKNGTHHFTFSRSSYSGPRVISEFDVEFEKGTVGATSCEIKVNKAADNSHKFSVVSYGGSPKWRMTAPPGARVPELECNVQLELRSQLCQASAQHPSDEDAVPRIIPLCTDANRSSPICGGDGSRGSVAD